MVTRNEQIPGVENQTGSLLEGSRRALFQWRQEIIHETAGFQVIAFDATGAARLCLSDKEILPVSQRQSHRTAQPPDHRALVTAGRGVITFHRAGRAHGHEHFHRSVGSTRERHPTKRRQSDHHDFGHGLVTCFDKMIGFMACNFHVKYEN